MTSELAARDREPEENESLQHDLQGSSKELLEPVQLYSPMNLAPNSPITVTSPGSIFLRVNGGTPVEVCAATPISIYAPVPIQLSPSEALGSDFLRGWHKLPDELKVRILSYNLVTPYAVAGPFAPFSNHLAMGPEIASLSREVFYKQNIFFLRNGRDRSNYLCFIHPNVAISHWIRHIKLQVGSNSEQDWRSLTSVSLGAYGLTKLRLVEVDYSWRDRSQIFTQDRWESYLSHIRSCVVVKFKCKGSVNFLRPTSVSRLAKGSWELNELDRRERDILERITFENVEEAFDQGKESKPLPGNHKSQVE